MSDLNARAATELFEFIAVNSTFNLVWEIAYLKRNEIRFNSPETTVNANDFIIWLGQELVRQGYSLSKAKELARKMRNAWRVKNCRKNNETVSLSISIERSVSERLTQMCKGEKKAEIISKLINGNYQSYLAEKRELAKQKAEQKERLMMQKENHKFKRIMTPSRACSSQSPCEELAKQLNLNKELTDGISKLHELKNKKNEQSK
ncbi:hypothetical protein ACRN9L_00880 [Shewanella oncorhynchi]|uniref:hypothetical protein n=1 Tax=Shewanella oncorhynchi TaxID=2726434 RepID=UPI003D7BB4D6